MHMGDPPVCITAEYIFFDEDETHEGGAAQLNASDEHELAALEALAGVSVQGAEAS
jgi:hypothetical protein